MGLIQFALAICLRMLSRRRSIKPNHFHDLNEFLECTDPSSAGREGIPWAIGHDERLAPGDVIYVKDKSGNSRISDTVMLVLRRSTDTQSSLTCLSFCAHPVCRLPTLHNTHRLVVPPTQPPPTDTTASRQQTPATTTTRAGGLTLRPVEVDLHLDGFRLKPELTLNCEELWNVEREVDVAVIGQVTASSFKEVVAHAKQLFCDSLEQAMKEMESPSPIEAKPASAATKIKTPDPAKARKHESDDKKRRAAW